jgi:hypothetical protein
MRGGRQSALLETLRAGSGLTAVQRRSRSETRQAVTPAARGEVGESWFWGAENGIPAMRLVSLSNFEEHSRKGRRDPSLKASQPIRLVCEGLTEMLEHHT